MTRMSLLSAAVALACAGCAGEQSASPADDGEVGSLNLYLTGVDSTGQQYRLRNAEFDLFGYPNYGGQGQTWYSSTLSTESEPDRDQIQVTLVPGTYYVSLNDTDWYLERLTPQGPEAIDDAVLLSSNPAYAYVNEHATSEVYFTFGVGGEVISFRHGNLRIGINVEVGDEDGGIPDEDAGSP